MSMIVFSTCSGVNPPLPFSSATDGCGDLNGGQRLLSLVKTALQKKKKRDHDDDAIEDQNDGDNKALLESAATAANKAVDDAIECLENLIAQTSRRGLLQGNVALAEKVLAATNSRNNNISNSNSNNNSGGKRKREKARNAASPSASLSSGLVIYADDFKHGEGGGGATAATTCATTTTLDVHLILSAILRILGASSQNKQADATESTLSCNSTIISPLDINLLVTMAADLCTAISEYIKTSSSNNSSVVVVMAEYELLAASAKQILQGLASCMQAQGIILTSSSSLQNEGEEEHAIALRSCLRTASSLIGLFGTKLARSVAILQQLNKVAWQFVVVFLSSSSSSYHDDENENETTVVDAATILLSSLPCAGGAGGGLNRVTPSQLWNASFGNVMQMLTLLLQAVVPTVSQRLGKITSTSIHLMMMDETFKTVLDNMIQNIALVKDIQYQQQERRVTLFLHYIHALCRLMCHYLSSSQQQLALRQVSVATFLDLIDVLLSFPMASEAAYYGTKKRLRMEIVNGGLLNIKSIVMHVANPLKLYGFQLLNALVAAMGGPLLLPFASRLTRMSHAALLTSASNTVRSVLDPAQGVAAASSNSNSSNRYNNNNKRRRWLNTSIVVRTAGLRSLGHIVQTFGAIDESKNNNNNSVAASLDSQQQHRIASETDRAIALVAACLVEQVQLANNNTACTSSSSGVAQQQQEEWGSLQERVELVIQATKCLQAYLLSHSGGGAFLSMEARTLIESVAESCLTMLISSSSSTSPPPVLGYTVVQASFLSLGTSCVCTAWPDGGASALKGILCNAAGTCQYRSSNNDNNNNELVLASSTALRLCESLANPRVPAIQIVTRQQQQQQQQSIPSGGSSRIVTHASDLASRLEQAHSESKRLAEEEKARDEARRNRQKEKDTSSNKKVKTISTAEPPKATPETETKQQTSRNMATAMDKQGNESTLTKMHKQQLDSSQTIDGAKPNLLSTKAAKKDSPTTTITTTTTQSTIKEQDKEDNKDNVGGEEDDDDDFPMIMNVGPDDDDK